MTEIVFAGHPFDVTTKTSKSADFLVESSTNNLAESKVLLNFVPRILDGFVGRKSPSHDKYHGNFKTSGVLQKQS